MLAIEKVIRIIIVLIVLAVLISFLLPKFMPALGPILGYGKNIYNEKGVCGDGVCSDTECDFSSIKKLKDGECLLICDIDCLVCPGGAGENGYCADSCGVGVTEYIETETVCDLDDLKCCKPDSVSGDGICDVDEIFTLTHPDPIPDELVWGVVSPFGLGETCSKSNCDKLDKKPGFECVYFSNSICVDLFTGGTSDNVLSLCVYEGTQTPCNNFDDTFIIPVSGCIVNDATSNEAYCPDFDCPDNSCADGYECSGESFECGEDCSGLESYKCLI